MSADTPHHRAADLVLHIEQAMRTAGFWHEEPPAPADMASRTPFCADTLAFTEWLQFVFLARMRQLIQSGGALPAQSGIAVMAQAKLASDARSGPLIERIQAFDDFIEQQA